MDFTFYGDLLGFSNYYKLSPQIAYQRLNDFYNTVHDVLGEYCNDPNNKTEIMMMSDSLLIWGDNAMEMLEYLHRIYIELIHRGLFLRGAIVDKKLERVPQFNLKNFDDFLPTDDTLARAVGLSEMKKGSRLLIDNKLAQDLLAETKEWLTPEGYIRAVRSEIPIDSILRRISPTPDCETFELLYFWSTKGVGVGYEQRAQELTDISSMLDDSITLQYKSTIELLKRCKKREVLTLDKFNKG